jgi:hypothetical protein
MTPDLSLNVHSVASSFASQLSASTGCSSRVFGSDTHRNSPVWPSMARPPWSPTVTGLIAPVGTMIAARTVPPDLIEPDEPPVPPPVPADVPPVSLAPPHAATIAPSSGIDMPITVPRRTNSRRVSLPEISSSIRWFSSSVRWRLMSSIAPPGYPTRGVDP